jgi:prepilin-type N-terminal cleavage/methylation domain-containing protein
MNHVTRPVRGFTLIELVVALVIAVFVVLASSGIERMRARTQQTQTSMDGLQRQAQGAVYRMTKGFYGAYYLWFDPATPGEIYLQTLIPGSLGVPPDFTLADNSDNFTYTAYLYDATTRQIIYRERVCPLDRDTHIGGEAPPMRSHILATNVDTLLFEELEGNLFQVDMTVRDPNTARQYVLGPMQLANRQMVANPPTGWEPVQPPGCLP